MSLFVSNLPLISAQANKCSVGDEGQNLAASGSTNAASLLPMNLLAESITNLWYYGEVNVFLPSYYGQEDPDETNFSLYGHFTQLVWAGSTSIGCASQLCAAGTIFAGFPSWFTVCNYAPAGMFSPR